MANNYPTSINYKHLPKKLKILGMKLVLEHCSFFIVLLVENKLTENVCLKVVISTHLV